MNGYGRGEDKQSKEKASSVITRETFGMTLLLFSVALLFISIIGTYMLGEIGVAITAFLMGVFGFFLYPFLLFCIGLSLRMISGKKFFAGKRVLLTLAVVASVFLVVHLATSARYLGNGFGSYMGGCWNAAKTSAAMSTGGGVLFGVIVYPVQALLSRVGAYLVFSLLIALSVFFFLWTTPLKDKLKKARTNKGQTVKKVSPADEEEPAPAPLYGKQARSRAPQETRYEEPRYEEPRYAQEPQFRAPQEQPQYNQPQYNQPQYNQQQYNQPLGQAYGRYEPQQPQQPQQQWGRGGAYNAPYMNDFDRYTPPMPQSSPVDSMDILYGTDPASSYRNNPIFNKDSRYNTQRRRSSVEPEDSPVRANPREIPVSFEQRYESREPQGYAERYAAQTEAPRPAMPRKVVEQRAQSPATDLNYANRPYYKAPDAPDIGGERGFYEKDVPYETEYSSAPNIDDVEPQEEPREEPQEFKGDLRRASLEPTPEPVKSEPRSETFAPEPRSEMFAPETADRSAPAARDEGRDDLRRLFGGDRSDRSLGGDMGFGDRSGRSLGEDRGFERSDRSFDSNTGFERSDRSLGEDRGFDRSDRPLGGDMGFGDRSDRSFGEEDAGDSRAADGLSRADMFDDDEDDMPGGSASRSRNARAQAAEAHLPPLRAPVDLYFPPI